MSSSFALVVKVEAGRMASIHSKLLKEYGFVKLKLKCASSLLWISVSVVLPFGFALNQPREGEPQSNSKRCQVPNSLKPQNLDWLNSQIPLNLSGWHVVDRRMEVNFTCRCSTWHVTLATLQKADLNRVGMLPSSPPTRKLDR